ncbi:nucleoside diphosphate kinase regulator [Aquincola sp. S2]|uniref:Nucleoside diphosphate kinase regulator n=1 Tax=Pseudaquabacterium terrae TaxID=2732868 RepID=A0ABX2ER30_9BURK|nr:nucleoside diphosphate kinase regulator [Aquabacterium terrae]NRF71175.1 nucleoside diphosphate kinase regulator [Aquabacterium terrae]
MDTMLLTERTLTDLDHARLKRLLAGTPAGQATSAALRTAMDNADLVPARAVPPDVVTMYSRVRLVASTTSQPQVLTLCYPEDAEPAEGFVSVLSPVGSALLGLRVGSLAAWQTPSGQEVRARVSAILFQPEASGDFVL